MERGRLPERIFLVGFMGVGKTTVGRALAERLGYEFVDTDDEVEAREGRTIERMFRESGEGYFREREWETLLSLAGRAPVVVATGGGLFLADVHQAFVRAHGVGVWLDAPLDTVWERCRQGTGRPLFGTREELERLLESRRERYARADLRVEVGGRATADIVDEILLGLAAAEGRRGASEAPNP